MPRTNVDKAQTKYRQFNDRVRGELKRRHQNQGMLADYLNISRPSLTLRLQGKVEWSLMEAIEAYDYFGFDISEIF